MVYFCESLWISEQTAITSAHSISWMGFTTKQLFTERYELDLYINYRFVFIFKGQWETNFDWKHYSLG